MAVLPAAVWRVRPSGNNTNGGGYDSTNYPGGTDYSQQDAAQASGSAGTAAGTAVFTDTVSASFTAAMVGNAIWIASGAGFTVGAYFVVSRQSATQVTLDRSPGTGTVAAWKLGGGWADFWTNMQSGASGTGPVVAGNTVFILGSGTPNPASYTYDYTVAGGGSFVSGDNTNGYIFFANDPSTLGYKAPPDTTGGMPVCKAPTDSAFFGNALIKVLGLWFVAQNSTTTGIIVVGTQNNVIEGCVFDQLAFDAICIRNTNPTFSALGCELFSSTAPGASGSNSAISVPSSNARKGRIIACNIHDTVGAGIDFAGDSLHLSDTIIAKCRGSALTLTGPDTVATNSLVVQNCTIDGNLGNGIELVDKYVLGSCAILSNIISNHVQAGTYGIKSDTGTTAVNDMLKGFIDYNVYYNNTTDLNTISYGTHDTHGGADPYVGQSTENYTLA